MQEQSTWRKPDITSLVVASLQNILVEQEKSALGIEAVNESTNLIGQQAALNSLGLVALLIDLEQKFDELYGISLTLADERALSQKHSPFRTVNTLAEYIWRLLQEAPQYERA